MCELCPACFIQLDNPNDLYRRRIISVDGNFQHCRMKRAAPDSFDVVDTPMFINFASSEVCGQDVGNDEFISSCTHFFVAATEKPKTMTEYDETGLIGVVCRHGTPLRYMNMYQGERME